MLRVLYLLNFAGQAGTERYVETLVRQLKGNRIEAYFAYHIEGLLVSRMEEMGIPVFRLPMKRRFDFQAAKALAALCREHRIDVIHTHYLRENYTAMLSKRWNPDVKVIYTNHFIMVDDWITRLSNRALSKRQDRVIAVCNKGREQLIHNGLDAGKIRVIFNGVDPEAWSVPPEDTLRRELGIPDTDFVMLCASRFAEYKGHRFLMEAVNRLAGITDRPFHLILADEGELLEEIKARVKELGLTGRVVFAGFQRDMKRVYHGCDLYISASKFEALSFLIIEAMASGLPVIATDVGGNRDIVNPRNDCGLLVPYDDPQAMAEAMKTLMERPELAERYRKGAKKAVEECFHLGKTAEATYGVYLEAMGKTGRDG